MGDCGESSAQGEEEGWWEGSKLPLRFEGGAFDCSGEHGGAIIVICSVVLWMYSGVKIKVISALILNETRSILNLNFSNVAAKFLSSSNDIDQQRQDGKLMV